MYIRLKCIILLVFLSASYANSQCCTYTIIMHDSYGDGWNGGSLEVYINNVSIGEFKAENFVSSDTFTVCNDASISFFYKRGECMKMKIPINYTILHGILFLLPGRILKQAAYHCHLVIAQV
nr:hypothetical protein [Candidatus Brachybacter algidus]